LIRAQSVGLTRNVRSIEEVRKIYPRLTFFGGMNKLGRVSSKGQVVIPAELRKKLKITRTVLIREEGGKTVMELWVSMEEAFGSGGKEMIEAAIEISRDRRREVEFERRSYAFDPASSSSSRPVSHP